MTAPRARVLRQAEGPLTPLLDGGLPPSHARLLGRAEVEARLAAERVQRAARADADALVAAARAAAASVADELRHEASAELSARWIALRAAEAARVDALEPRLIQLASALAERLLGSALELRPELVASLAREVLDEARGARRAVLDAHPLDAAALRSELDRVRGGLAALEVHDDPALARGALRLHTDLGDIDAPVGPRLERLARALRDALDP